MRYVSTRGQAPELDFEDVLLTGLARDGGLYVPAHWPKMSENTIRALGGLSYAELAVRVIRPFVGDCIPEEDLYRLVKKAYSNFDHAAVAPLRQVGASDWLLELFHGPTLAFKDYALQLVGLLFDHVLAKRKQRVTIIGATSGDTGSAAIEACRDREAVDIFILHPMGRVSEVQRRQMTTVDAPNVHNIAVNGNFDDCQNLVKAMFNDQAFRDELSLSAVNSINWARIMAQIVYYFHAAVALGAPDRQMAFAVPTGNFGNIFAGYAAREMGLPIAKLICGSNANDILTRYFTSNDMTMAPVQPTTSPSMDIAISSNFERLLFELYRRDGDKVRTLMDGFAQNGSLAIDDPVWEHSRELFDSWSLDDSETAATIADFRARNGEMLDPHSAIGVAASWARRPAFGLPVVSLATAHPAKFPDAVEKACGERPQLPPRLADLLQRPEHYETVPNDLNTIQDHIRRHSRAV